MIISSSVMKFVVVLYFQWQEQRDQLNEKGTMILDALMRATQLQSTDTGLPGLDVAGKCFKQLSDSYDSEFGGFGDAPKFPQPGKGFFIS